MAHRTTIVLDEPSRDALEELSRTLGCSRSEAIRRAILHFRDRSAGVSPERRRARTEALRRLFELTDGGDPAAEVARLKAEDEFG